jgi:iron(II)-dependent oxidoreductase
MMAGDQIIARRFPWGNIYDKARANLWEAGIGQTVPVTDFASGDNPAGVRQLIGNVWQWMTTDFAAFDIGADLEADAPIKSLRGGAFDTYFSHQAGWRFQSGDQVLARRHNVGFRCALTACDVAEFSEHE